MNFAIVGLGRWGRVMIKNLKAIDGNIVAVCARKSSSFDSLPAQYRIYPFYDDIGTMLKHKKKEIDTVIIATHPDTHFALSCQALWHDKHVICEKPCMFSNGEFWKIQELAEGKIFFTDYTNLYHSVIHKMRDLIDVAPPRYELRLVNSGFSDDRKGYSDLWDYGSHVASVIYTLFPDEYFQVQFGRNAEGNHTMLLKSQDVDVEASFGNKSGERKHSFALTPYNFGQSVEWTNDGSENPLGLMLRKFELGEIQTNINLSLKISHLLKQGE